MDQREERVKGEHSDSRIRCNSTYRHETFRKLEYLSSALSLPPATLQREMVEYCVNNEAMINHFQEKYKRRSVFKIVPTMEDGKMVYKFVEKKKKNPSE